MNAAVTAANTDASVGGCSAGSGADTIRLTANVILTTALPEVTSTITIEGGGFFLGRSLLDMNKFRVLKVAATGDLSLDSVTIGGGSSDTGAGIHNLGSLALSHTTVTANTVAGVYSHTRGGGIRNQGKATIADSTISFNYATSSLGAASGGGISNDSTGTLSISNTTLAGNMASAAGSSSFTEGGGISSSSTSSGSFTISNSTVSDNSATAEVAYGGGIHALFLHMSNTTVSGNTADGVHVKGGGVNLTASTTGSTFEHVTFAANEATSSIGNAEGAAIRVLGSASVSGSLFSTSVGADHCDGSLTDAGGGNLSDTSAICLPTIAQTLTGLDSVRADNGGPTMTHKLLGGSSAINIAGACGIANDQRGAGRITSCDSGAFEYIGCDLLELDFQIVSADIVETTCNTALLGPNLVIDPAGSLEVTAGWQVVIKNGFLVEPGAEMVLGN